MNAAESIRTQDRNLHLKATARFARAISWIGHPLVFVSISVAIVVTMRLAPRIGLPILAALFLSVIAPTAILLFLGVRSGRWRDADVSVREERHRFYPLAIPFSALGTFALWLIRAPGFVLRGGIVTLALFILAAIVNLRLKISLHTLFACYCSVILFRLSPASGVAALTLTTLVFWSRLFLGRHTMMENVAGVVLGFFGGVIVAWWP